MTARTAERLEALSCILCDGLSYSWFWVEGLDDKKCNARVRTSTNDDEVYDKVHAVTADDVARGLRMVREYFNGKRELYAGEWDFYRKDNPDWQPAKGSTDSYLYQLILFDRTNGEDGDYDANTADMVMQFAILGEVRYG